MSDPRPIGLFDSGVGGLTVLEAVARRMPFEDLLYLGDTARLPYGTKSPETVRRYARRVAEVQEVFEGHAPGHRLEHREAADTRVEETDRPRVAHVRSAVDAGVGDATGASAGGSSAARRRSGAIGCVRSACPPSVSAASPATRSTMRVTAGRFFASVTARACIAVSSSCEPADQRGPAGVPGSFGAVSGGGDRSTTAMPSRNRYAPRRDQPSGKGFTSSGRRGPSITAPATDRRNATSSRAAGTSRASGWSWSSFGDSKYSDTRRAGIGVGGMAAVGRRVGTRGA